MSLAEGWAAIGERVRRARVAERLSQGELAKRMGLDDRTVISKIERGERRIDGLELARIGKILRVPLNQFLEDPPQVISRRGGLVAEETTDDETAVFRVQTELVSWMHDVRQLREFGVIRPSRPLSYKGAQSTPAEARVAAQWLRRHLGIGRDPIASLMTTVESIGLLFAVIELDGEGASLNCEDFAVAVVNRKSEFGRRRSTAAHELGHVFLGDEYSTEISVHASREEREAVIDAFGSEFLLPAAVFKGRADELTRRHLIEIAARYRVSWTLAIRQAELAEAIGEREAKDWGGEAPTRAEFMDALGWAPQPDLEKMAVTPVVAHAVMEAHARGLIAAGRAVEIMRGQISESDLPDLDEARDLWC